MQLCSIFSSNSKLLLILFVCIVEITGMREFEHLISCKATFLSDEVVQLPIGREFLSKPVKARGEWFITFYFGWHHQVELVKLINMKDLKDFKG